MPKMFIVPAQRSGSAKRAVLSRSSFDRFDPRDWSRRPRRAATLNGHGFPGGGNYPAGAIVRCRHDLRGDVARHAQPPPGHRPTAHGNFAMEVVHPGPVRSSSW
jgi:hypothetical protein